MTITLGKQMRFLLFLAVGAVFILGSLGVLWFMALPKLSSTRSDIDNRRASIVVAEQRRNNLQALATETQDLSEQQKKINGEMWAFTAEDSFFQVWPSLAKKNNVTIDDPTVSDATPGPNPVVRTVKLTLEGNTNGILATLNDIQGTQPLIAITKVSLSSGQTPGRTSALIEATTLWR